MNLDSYLNHISGNSDLQKHLSRFENVVKFATDEERVNGLLKYKELANNTAFLFIFEMPEKLVFHTIGMCCPLDILFFDENEKLVSQYLDVIPGRRMIMSNLPAKYVVESKSDYEKTKIHSTT